MALIEYCKLSSLDGVDFSIGGIDLREFADSWAESFPGVTFANLADEAAAEESKNSPFGHLKWLTEDGDEAAKWMETAINMAAVTVEDYDFYKHIEAAEYQQAKEFLEEHQPDIYEYLVYKIAAEINPAITDEQCRKVKDTCFNGYETVDEIRAAVTEILSK